ncbi:methyl-accepting chemotaxis protein [Paramaledivibacter caminithermalis]|uniref:Methyl-accepting chemotaxis protein n=1 Tax=Paramaledivibacter caminithermalis (strain DSM 15212 / CIP 107654 / DViRD3) TaxID=1121301 RepID=A0A1M6P8H4_PARC5|nr:methyl-accepting chemotaxis protein [Paramaledivibacter caminithermalis]SHK04267.1 methyl-accepting chemotaxis protein [Paramaledivibacter caminithermalis DSM 15212]
MRSKKRLNLMTKLMACFLILIILPVSVVGVYSYENAKNALKTEAEKTLNMQLNGIVNNIELQMEKVEELGSVLSKLPDVIKYSNEIESGNVTQETLRLTEEILKRFQKSISKIGEDIFIANKEGVVILDASNGLGTGVDLYKRQYFKESISGKNHWSEVIFSKQSNKPVTVYSLPLKASNGDIVGVIGIVIKFENIAKFVKNVKVGDTGYAYMINKEGVTIQHPNNEKILEENLLQTDNKDLKEQVKNMIKGEKGHGFYTYEGIYKLNMYGPVGNYWAVAVNIPVKDYMKAAVDIRNKTLIISIAGILLGILAAYFISKQITMPIKDLMKLMGKAEKGDLTVEANIKNKDEIGDLANSFNNMIKGQKNAITKVFETARQLDNSSQQTSSVSEEMASSAQNQSELLQELTNTMNEMSRSIGEVAQSATEMAHNSGDINNSIKDLEKAINEVSKSTEDTTGNIVDITGAIKQMNTSIETVAHSSNNASVEAVKTVEIAEKGKKAVTNTINEMDKINEGMKNLTEVIKGLGGAAVQIGDIVEVIDDIAEQTNLLSLNASIEAARAGEHGKGFAVVAGAIGALAEKSSEATKDIAFLIRKIQQQVDNAVNTTNEGAKQVDNGVNLVKNTGKALDEIFQAINITTNLIQEIASSTEEQTTASKLIMEAIEKINDLSIQVSAAIQQQIASIGTVALNVERLNDLSQEVASAAEQQAAASQELLATTESINEMTKEVSAGSEETAATAEDLASQSNNLIEVVGKFKIE